MSLVFDELRSAAHFYFQREDPSHTLQPTALVSEVCLRLMGWRKVRWENRQQFFSFAGQLMRRLLIDYAKHRKAEKRGSKFQILPLTGALDRDNGNIHPVTLLALEQGLSKLERLDQKIAQIVELRFFTGLSAEETARALGISRSSVTRAWSFAKDFLARELNGEAADTVPKTD